MELKQYQRNVMNDLQSYLAILEERRDLKEAFADFWLQKGIPVGTGLRPAYQNLIPGVPNLCFKVPTGGGKTFMAACSIKPILDSMPQLRYKVVVWLVPSDSIMEQTLRTLNDPDHPYRQQLNQDFGHRVEIYTKDQAKMGQNFSPVALNDQLSILVLSYDSFRTARADGRTAYRESGYLGSFENALGIAENPIDGADMLSLYQVVNQLMPLVIVDESHHARSPLSLQMLRDFNPCFVLDLTATPKRTSNVISYVEAAQLKIENMVKLPVIVYNRESRLEVLNAAKELRVHLEQVAIEQQRQGGPYVRPIVLFQAQPRVSEDATTFEKLRELLLKHKIPAEHIAIKTGERNELKGFDLLSPDCQIRYIITVNALKEGWDCPFAYVLASLANRSSPVEVEQILGRVLRQPYARALGKPELNMCYVVTSSDDFSATVKRVVEGLEAAGFSAEDYREGGNDTSVPGLMERAQSEEAEQEDFFDLIPSVIPSTLDRSESDAFLWKVPSGTQEMLIQAIQLAEEYQRQAAAKAALDEPGIPAELCRSLPSFTVISPYREKIKELILPQFFLKTEASIFAEGYQTLLEKEHLNEGFTLTGKSYDIALDTVDDQVYKVDLVGNTPVYAKLSGAESNSFREIFSATPPEHRVELCKKELKQRLQGIDSVVEQEIVRYIDLIVNALDREKLGVLAKSLDGAARRIREQIESHLTDHRLQQFKTWMDQGQIECEPSYKFPAIIYPAQAEKAMAKALYEAEGDLNPLERRMVESLAALPNILWWHRNPTTPRVGFRLNGFINHYPDIIAYTTRGHLVLVETKGEHLNNPDSQQKLRLGRYWKEKAGNNYRYYMVFERFSPQEDGAYKMDDFLRMAEGL